MIRFITNLFDKKERTLVPFLYFLFSIFFLYKIVAFKGFIIGEDIAFPITNLQSKFFWDSNVYTWISNLVLSYRNNSTGYALPLQAIWLIFRALNLGPMLFLKAFMVFVFWLPSVTMYLFLRYMNIRKATAFVAGLFYITTPLFFDYMIMGWFFVLLAMGLLPLAVYYFVRSVKESNLNLSLLAGIFYALAFIQSQSIVWFGLVFLFLAIYLIRDTLTLKRFLASLAITMLVYVLLNFYIIFPLIIIPDPSVSGSDYLNAAASIGMTHYLFPINIIRLWGSLYNFQYETIVRKQNLELLSFIVPILLTITLFIKQRRQLIISLWCISIIPLLMYFLNQHREWLSYVPFSNVIRDFSRFSVLANFAYPILLALVVDYLWKKTHVYKLILIVLFAGWLTYLYPWWSFELTAWEHRNGMDSRLTEKEYPEEFFRLETKLASLKLDQKMLYLPPSYNGSITDDDKKYPSGLRDIFAINSPVPGLLTKSDRKLGPTSFIDFFTTSLYSDLRMLNFMPVKQIIDRKNFEYEQREKLESTLLEEEKQGILKSSEDGSVRLYKLKQFVPHFITTNNSVVANEYLNVFAGDLNKANFNPRTSFFLRAQNQKKSLESLPSSLDRSPYVEFKKINPIKYRLIIHGAQGNFPLVFSESFHDGWKIYPGSSVKNESIEKLSKQIQSYKIIENNEEDQASKEELYEYINMGLVSNLGDSKQKTTKHFSWQNGRERLDHEERYSIDFVSKNFQNTIQNDNLLRGKFSETYFKKPLIEESSHLVVNGYANAWIISSENVCDKSPESCVRNADNTKDLSLVVEFWPQRIFYFSLLISTLTLIGVLAYLAYNRKKMHKNITI